MGSWDTNTSTFKPQRMEDEEPASLGGAGHIRRVLKKGKRAPTAEDAWQLEAIVPEMASLSRIVLDRYAEQWPERKAYVEEMRTKIAELVSSKEDNHVKVSRGEKTMRAIAAAISEACGSSEAKRQISWVEGTMADLFRFAKDMRFALDKLGYPAPLYGDK